MEGHQHERNILQFKSRKRISGKVFLTRAHTRYFGKKTSTLGSFLTENGNGFTRVCFTNSQVVFSKHRLERICVVAL